MYEESVYKIVKIF